MRGRTGRGIYFASKTLHAPHWRRMRADGIPIVSTWIDESGRDETACLADLWTRCIEEASGADALIAFRQPGDVLKGAFIEVGAALAWGVPVFAVGCDDLTFVRHPLVTSCAGLLPAVAAAMDLCRLRSIPELSGEANASA